MTRPHHILKLIPMCSTFVLKNVIGNPLILLLRALPVTSVICGITMAVLKLRGMNLSYLKKIQDGSVRIVNLQLKVKARARARNNCHNNTYSIWGGVT